MYQIQDILDFANMVFSMSSGSTNFARLLPKAYGEERHTRLKHHVIEEQGRIQGLIDVYPFTLMQKNMTLQAGYIGTVSVHPSCEGKGYMRCLMEQAQEQARTAGMDILLCDGDRHRYGYYGFEKAGMKYCFNITDASLKHGCRSRLQGERELMFEQVDETGEYLDIMYACYRKRYVTARTKEEFMLCLQSWNATTYAILEQGQCIGYLNVSYDERNLFEIGLLKEENIYAVLDAWDREFGVDELGVNIGADEQGMIALLEPVSDYYTVNLSHQIKILNYEKVLRFLLSWKSCYCDLEKRRYVIGIIEDGLQKNYACHVNEASIEVTQVSEGADLVLEAREFVKIMTTSYFWYAQNQNKSIKKTPEGWFPLPFFLPEADAF